MKNKISGITMFKPLESISIEIMKFSDYMQFDNNWMYQTFCSFREEYIRVWTFTFTTCVLVVVILGKYILIYRHLPYMVYL